MLVYLPPSRTCPCVEPLFPQWNRNACPSRKYKAPDTTGTPFVFSAVSPAVRALFSRKPLSQQDWFFRLAPGWQQRAAGQVWGAREGEEEPELQGRVSRGWRKALGWARQCGKELQLCFSTTHSCVRVEKTLNISEVGSSGLNREWQQATPPEVAVRTGWGIPVVPALSPEKANHLACVHLSSLLIHVGGTHLLLLQSVLFQFI